MDITYHSRGPSGAPTVSLPRAGVVDTRHLGRQSLRPLAVGLCLSLASAIAGCDAEDNHQSARGTSTAATETRSEPQEPSPTTKPTPSQLPAENALPLLKRSRPMMGTIFQITVSGASEAQAYPAMDAALQEIARLESVLSEWDPATQISRVNASAGDKPVVVDDDALRVVTAGLEVSRLSDGAFDLSWAALRGVYDFRPGHLRMPRPGELKDKLPLIDFRQIEVSEANKTVFLKQPGMVIGTGGIGKGYALDRAADILKAAGLESFMLFGGGQVQVHGLKAGRPWRVGIQHPRKGDAYFGFLEVEAGSISTSGDYEHYFIDDKGRRYHHILDVRTGKPAQGTLSVTLLAPEGLHADALSTACFILGPAKCLRMLEKVPGAEAVIVDDKLRLYFTPGTREKLRLTEPLDGDRLSAPE